MLDIKEGKKYIEYIRGTPCLICGRIGADPDHLETVGRGGNRKKDMWEHFTCIPLCRIHHTERHNSMKKFEEKYRINCWREAFRLFRSWARH